jgi:hypothetical protein
MQANDKPPVLIPSTLETVDMAFYDFVNNLNISATTNDGFKRVPIIWMTAERAFHIKNDKDIRELDSQTLVYPLISIERVSTTKTKPNERPLPGNKFPYGDYKKGVVTIARKINKEKTRNFVNADSKRLYGQENSRINSPKTVYQYISIPLPVFATMNYEVKIRSQYQQQINEIMLPFINYSSGWNYFMIDYEKYKYEVFMDSENEFKSNSSNQANDEKKYDAKFKFKVQGYTTTIGENQQTPTTVYRENAVVVRFSRETTVLGEVNEFVSNPQNKSFRP